MTTKISSNNYLTELTTDERFHYVKDHLGSVRLVIDEEGEISSARDYYAYGAILQEVTIGEEEKYKFTEKERDSETGLDYFGARYYDSDIGRWMSVDPLADKFPWHSPYNYVLNNPLIIIDPNGMDTLYVSDQNNRPQDNGTEGTSYTADVYVVQNGVVVGAYPNGGSSYPNSVSNTDNSAAFSTINEGEHSFNNASGHKGGTQQGLNVVDANGSRVAPGTSSTGDGVTIEYVNVHKGFSNNGNYNSRGSQGCVTLNPDVSSNVLGHFNWNGNTGNSSGSVIIQRNGTANIPFGNLTPKPLSFR